MKHTTIHRALEIQKDICIGCSHCMKVCPTEALRVINGKALLYAEWCIDCGACFRECPTRAIRVVDDDFMDIYKYEYRVLLVPLVFYAQFEGSIPVNIINQILGDIGFSEVCVVEQSVDGLIPEVNSYVSKAKNRPVISSFCPAVIRLLQIKFPSLLDKIMLLIPPLEVCALYYKKKMENDEHGGRSLGIFYMTPCIGKIAAVKNPVGGYTSPINGVINMDLIYNKVLLAYKNKNFGSSRVKINMDISSFGAAWPTTGGEAAAVQGRTLAIDGMENVIDFLEKFENGEVGEGIDFLELRGCDESCAGGILLQHNRFLMADYIRRIAKSYPPNHPLMGDYQKYCAGYISMEPIAPRSMVKYDSDIEKAIKKMERAREIMRVLPGIDCGACGAPSCEALAADIVRDDATLNNCIFMQVRYEKDGSLSFSDSISVMEKVWGKDRFINKDNSDDNES